MFFRHARQQQRQTEREVKILMRMPDGLVRCAMWLRTCSTTGTCCRYFLIRDDPLNTTLFVAI